MNFVITPAARQDVLSQYRFYFIEREAEAAAERFLDAVQSTIDRICRTPAIGTPKHLGNPRLSGLRSWPVKGFADTRIYYLAGENTVRIVRVLHGKRDIDFILEDDLPETKDRNT